MGCLKDDAGRRVIGAGAGRVGVGGVGSLLGCGGINDCTFDLRGVFDWALDELEGTLPKAILPANVGLTTRLPVSIEFEGRLCWFLELIPKNRVSSAAC